MISEKVHEKVTYYVKYLQKFVDRLWYPPVLSLLALLDNYFIIIPTDGLLISSTMITPKRWSNLAINIAVGSTIGAFGLAMLVEYQGLPFILDLYPGIDQTSSWAWTVEFFDKYGLFLVFLVSVTPFVQQPAVILATLANTPMVYLLAVIFVGRLIKYLIMAYIASHAPKLLTKMWGLKNELKEVGLDTEGNKEIEP